MRMMCSVSLWHPVYPEVEAAQKGLNPNNGSVVVCRIVCLEMGIPATGTHKFPIVVPTEKYSNVHDCIVDKTSLRKVTLIQY